MRPATSLIRAGFTFATLACAAGLAAASDVVISQFYTCGGSTGAAYKNDYVELFNRGTSPVSLTGWTLQGMNLVFGEWGLIADLSGTMAPGSYYLIQVGHTTQGSGLDLPAPDAVSCCGGFGCGGGESLVLSPTSNQYWCQTGVAADRVGYGNPSYCPEGTYLPAPGFDQAALRGGAGCTDTDNNLADFTFGPPTPRNSASPPYICGVTGVGPIAPPLARLGVPIPNPSSIRTDFAYTVSRDGLVRLEVFDLKGRRICSLVNGWRPAGAAHASWDGVRDDGRNAGAGVYFVRFSDSRGGTPASQRFVRTQ